MIILSVLVTIVMGSIICCHAVATSVVFIPAAMATVAIAVTVVVILCCVCVCLSLFAPG